MPPQKQMLKQLFINYCTNIRKTHNDKPDAGKNEGCSLANLDSKVLPAA